MTPMPDALPATLNVTGGFATLAATGSDEATARLAGQNVRLVAFSGTGGWHRHETAEETVIVWSGVFDVEYRDGTVRLEAGQCTVIPCGAGASRRVGRRRAGDAAADGALTAADGRAVA